MLIKNKDLVWVGRAGHGTGDRPSAIALLRDLTCDIPEELVRLLENDILTSLAIGEWSLL